MPTSSTNIFWDKIITPMKTYLISEFGGGMKVYVGEQYEQKGNLSMRLHCRKSSLISEGNGFQEKQYFVEMCYYLIDANPTERTWEKVYKDIGRVEQVVFDNKNQPQPSGFINGRIEEIVVNSKTTYESNVDDLIKVYLDFRCNYVGNVN